MPPSEDELVRIYPTGLAFIDNVPAVVQDVTPERADELLAYFPAAFTTEVPPVPGPMPDSGAVTEEVSPNA